MGKKKKKRAASTTQQSAEHNDNMFTALYGLLIMCGAAPQPGDIVTEYTDGASRVSIAMPDIRFAICLPGDTPEGLTEQGWRHIHVTAEDIEVFARVFFSVVQGARIARVYANADPNIKTTTEPEEKLYQAFIRHMMDVPDRNYVFRREDGTELTVPDFTWEKYRVAFFMDGAYWHSVKDDKDVIREIQKNQNFADSISDKRKDKVRKDGAIRSELSSRGWFVLSCTDDDIRTHEGVEQVVATVKNAINNAKSLQNISQESITSSNTAVISDIFSQRGE